VSALHVNPATMRERDLTRETKANARAAGFRAKKWYKDLINGHRRHAAAIIGNCDADLPFVEPTVIDRNAWS
jgi:hypothetical protein